jgi:omega-hydroxy-beta-dihydromenaquinone-9 sulfotransferase
MYARCAEKVARNRPSTDPAIEYPFYAWRMWEGMTLSSWVRILARNRCAISPARLPRAALFTIQAAFNSVLSMMQRLIFGKCIAGLDLDLPPLFIIGHWRTGTTHLHELLTLDERFTAPTTLQCFVPAHFLISRRMLRIFSFLLPEKRPMDDVAMSLDSPQEDEFALLNLGVPSPYETMMFPNHRPVGHEFLNMSGVAREQVDAWKAGLLRFLQLVNYSCKHQGKLPIAPRRIVLKSPPHTARLAILRSMFPAAQFIHLVRHPCDVFASTVWLWRVMYNVQGFQIPRFDLLPNGAPSIGQYVLDTMELIYRDFRAQAAQIPSHQFCEVRYEDLVRAPIVEMERIYRELKLGGFETARPKLECRLHKLKSYKRSGHRVSEAERAEIFRRWRWYAEQYGYGGAPG